ncbi:hypothetical protein Tco_0577881 [Tanacetum coccineum]
MAFQVDLEPDECSWISDAYTYEGNEYFLSYKAYNRGNVIFGSNLRGNIIGKGHQPVDGNDLDKEEAIREIEKKNLEIIVEDETFEIDEIVNIKESRNHPLENVLRMELQEENFNWKGWCYSNTSTNFIEWMMQKKSGKPSELGLVFRRVEKGLKDSNKLLSLLEAHGADSVGKPLYNRFTKTNDFKGVPHPLSGDYTPTPQEEIDESLYVYVLRYFGTSSEHSVDPESEISSVPPEVYVSTPITTNEKEGENLGKVTPFTTEEYFFCGSLVNLIKDCDFMKRKWQERLEFKKQRSLQVLNTGNGVAKPVWTNDKQGEIGGSAVKTSAGYNWRNSNPNSNCNSGPTFIRTVNAKGPQGSSNEELVDRGIFDSGCSGHMTGNKDQLEDFEEFNEGYVTFRGSKGYISVGYSFWTSKDETSGILQNFIRQIENQFLNAFEEKDEDVELIVVPSTVRNTEEKVESRKSSTNSKKEEILTEPQQERGGGECFSTGHFRRYS